MTNKNTGAESPNPITALTRILILFLFFILPLVTCPLVGQVVQKKQLLPQDYPLWGELSLDKISPDDQWVSYKMTYQNAVDTLFVRNTHSGKTYSYPFGSNSIFTKNGLFICLAKQELFLQNLKTGKQEIIKSVKRFGYSPVTDHLIICTQIEKNTAELIVQTSGGILVKKISNVVDYSLSPNEQDLVYSTRSVNTYKLLSLHLKTVDTEKEIVTDSPYNLSGFTWQKDGKALAFISKPTKTSAHSVFYYFTQQNKLFQLPTDSLRGFPDHAVICGDQNFKLLVSDDLQKVFFNFKAVNSTLQNKSVSNVEIWNGNDKWIYPEEQIIGQFEKGTKTAVWMPAVTTVFPITTTELPKMMLSGDQQYAFLSNPKDYEPQFEIEGPRDFYQLNLKTLEKKLVIKKQSANHTYIVPSPRGKYIAYFSQNHWWIYTIALDTHTNITASIAATFTAKEHLLDPESVCGNPGWSKDDKAILLYDAYDIWAVSPDGLSSRRLTHGRESKIKYRIADFPNRRRFNFVYEGLKTDSFDLEKGLLLRAEGEDGKTGWFQWNNQSGEKAILYAATFTDQLLYQPNKENFFYREQNFDLSPRVRMRRSKEKIKTVFQSNPQQQKYFWGRSELIRYKNAKGKNLKGVLLYPANYDAQKKYPMIVPIYELQSKKLHHYVNPSSSSSEGFNSTAFTQEGYFVLLPDITHEYQNPGISALDCVTAATQKVINMGVVYPDKIGLMGHSFGGYETDFIITQSALFATAVSGGGISDLTTYYLTFSQNSGKPDMWRFEREQWMMGQTPFEAPLLYQKNSPLAHIEKIKIPLLLWAGKQDTQVAPHQTTAFYLALRRLGKKNIMLFYPEEGHILSNPLNRADLSKRLHQWFDYYLKDNVRYDWIRNGVN